MKTHKLRYCNLQFHFFFFPHPTPIQAWRQTNNCIDGATPNITALGGHKAIGVTNLEVLPHENKALGPNKRQI